MRILALIALLPISLVADERVTGEPKFVEVPQDSLHSLSSDWSFSLESTRAVPRLVAFDWLGAENYSTNALLAEIIKERQQLQNRPAEVESLIEILLRR